MRSLDHPIDIVSEWSVVCLNRTDILCFDCIVILLCLWFRFRFDLFFLTCAAIVSAFVSHFFRVHIYMHAHWFYHLSFSWNKWIMIMAIVSMKSAVPEAFRSRHVRQRLNQSRNKLQFPRQFSHKLMQSTLDGLLLEKECRIGCKDAAVRDVS